MRPSAGRPVARRPQRQSSLSQIGHLKLTLGGCLEWLSKVPTASRVYAFSGTAAGHIDNASDVHAKGGQLAGACAGTTLNGSILRHGEN